MVRRRHEVGLGVEEMLESRRDELLARKVNHNALIVELARSYLVGALFGVVYVLEVDERLTLVAVDEDLLDVVFTVRFEVVVELVLLELIAHIVQPERARRFALAEAEFHLALADRLSVHRSNRSDDALHVAELNERVRAYTRRLFFAVLFYLDLDYVAIFLVELLSNIAVFHVPF